MWWSFAAAEAAQAEFLRPAFMSYLRARGTDDSDFASAELIFGELVGNVVRHAPGPIAVTVVWRLKMPVLQVSDRGPGFSLKPALPQDVLSDGGRGLFLITAFGGGLSVDRGAKGGSRVSVVLPIARRDEVPVGAGVAHPAMIFDVLGAMESQPGFFPDAVPGSDRVQAT